MALDRDEIRDLVHLSLVPGLGSMLASRLLERFGSPSAVLSLSPAQFQEVRGIGEVLADRIARGVRKAGRKVRAELEQARRLGAMIIARSDPAYPPLLREIPDPPMILYVRGRIDALGDDRFPVAIVGSRSCTAYGIEQAERFAGVLARSGLTIVSGGARGIDSAAHRGALRAGGRTIVVLGCGLGECYPPENADLYDRIAGDGEECSGAVVSELPIATPPSSENFPARNRIISGLSLGVIVIEAGKRSGALITARHAVEEQGREAMALPGRVDSPTSAGSLNLIKSGGAALITEPGDVLALLESPAWHLHGGTHEARFAANLWSASPDGDGQVGNGGTPDAAIGREPSRSMPLTDAQSAILAALSEPRTLDQLAAATGLPVSELRAEATMLELQRRVVREGSRLVRARGS